MHGWFRDIVADERGAILRDEGWHRNTVTDGAWPVFSALLRNDPAIRGILFCAVGAGDNAWDAGPLTLPGGGARAATRLVAEHDRGALGTADFAYLDPGGLATTRPTDRLEITARFSWPAPRVLREFGLVGGDATAQRDSGYLINYVVHPRLDVRAGETLTRRVRFALRPGAGGGGLDWLGLPLHWFRTESVRLLDGVGDAYAAALTTAGLETIGALADAEPVELSTVIPLAKTIELRCKARLALRAAAGTIAVPALAAATTWHVLMSTPAALAAESGAPLTAVATLREQMAALQLALDARYLKRVTVGELTTTQ